MATTNAQQWNPTAANQENDAAYTADSQRAGGATNPAIFEAELANKAFYQWSTYITALFQAFAAKGFTTSDSNLNTLAATCLGFLTTRDLIAVATTAGGPLISATQVGATYGTGGPSNAAITATTQGAGTNFLFAGMDAAGNANFWVQADGILNATGAQIVGQLTVGTIQVAGLVDINGNLGVGGSITAAAVSATGNITGGGLISNGSAIISNDLNVHNTLEVGGFATLSGGLAVGVAGATVTGNLNTAQLQINGGAPNGQVLTGNGTSYVPQPLPTTIVAAATDVTAQRALNTPFTNTGTKPLLVSAIMERTATGGGDYRLDGFLNGVVVASNTSSSTIAGMTIGVTFMVPAGSGYSVNATALQGAASIALQHWEEWALSL